MNKKDIISQIKLKRSFLSIGLDTDIQKIPSFLLDYEDPVFEFNKRIIDATNDLCIAYKINIAFYESRGKDGWESLQRTLDYIPDNLFKVADAKRGDIGNTSTMYAKAFFENMQFDAITVAPYMGSDSVKPFLEFKDKWVILLALTSNKSSLDFQHLMNDNGKRLFENILDKSKEWGGDNNIMYVIGANRVEEIVKIRNIVPNHFLLVPGVGAQGANLEDFAIHAMNAECGLLVNSSRDIIYAGNDLDFDDQARRSARKLQIQMSRLLSNKGL